MEKRIIHVKESLLLFVIFALTLVLVLVGKFTQGSIIFSSFSPGINHQIVYQCITLGVALVFLLLLFLSKQEAFRRYFRKGNLSAPVIPTPLLGIKAGPQENWLHLGRNFSFVISGVTFLIIYFQLIKGSTFELRQLIKVLPFSLIFALTNSFVEEMITRFGVVVALSNTGKERFIPAISALFFGTVHFWGNPGGITGVLAAGFLAWILAKSIMETKGIFWAWFIHFLQDVIIFTVLLTYH